MIFCQVQKCNGHACTTQREYQAKCKTVNRVSNSASALLRKQKNAVVQQNPRIYLNVGDDSLEYIQRARRTNKSLATVYRNIFIQRTVYVPRKGSPLPLSFVHSTDYFETAQVFIKITKHLCQIKTLRCLQMLNETKQWPNE